MFKRAKEKTTLLAVMIGLCAVSIGFGQTAGPVAPWSHADVGSPVAGDAVTADGKIFKITGAGADIWGTADNFHYMFIPLSGDGAMSVLVTNNGTGTSNWTKGGVMIRETLEGGSKNVYIAISGGDGGGATFQRRATTGGDSASDHPLTGIAPPYWVRLVREGNTFSGYVSTDGVTWQQEGVSQDVAMVDPVYIGLAVTSHTAGELRTFTFENIVGEGGASLGDPGTASGPNPGNGSSDVIRDSSLSWKPGIYAVTHNVYFGDSLDAVDSATEPTSAGLDVNSFDPGRLSFGQTYYWRVDEVNVSPDKTVRKGNVWSFVAEPYSIQIPGSSMAVTASSASNEFSGPENTINGSGLGADDTHGITNETMWFTETGDLNPWIQYDFDDVVKLDSMKVWNSNGSAEMAIGWGVKDVEIQYSVDGENWDVLADVNQFSRAPGSTTYAQYDDVAFGGVAAKSVRFNILSNWGGVILSYSLSEVQFFMIPAKVRTPVPANGATDILPNSVVSWRAGRDAGQHVIYLSTDMDAVAEGSVASTSSSVNSLDLTSLDLQLGKTYYWRVDEVNDAEATPVWAGPVWSFSTPSTLTVDDFESYTNDSPNKIFQTWIDGFGYTTPEPGMPGNGTGAAVGHDTWTPSSPYYGMDFMETVRTLTGTGQSMPFYYDNSNAAVSQIDRVFAEPQDWTIGGAKTLSIAFSGQSGNTGTLYAKINNTKVTYSRSADTIAKGLWEIWDIDLTSMSVTSVTSLHIGVEGSNASGMLLIDDIKLSPEAAVVDSGDNKPLIAWVSFHGAADSPSTAAAGAGFTVAPDKAYTDLLEANGYKVVRYITTSTPDVATLNGVDLVIISRSVASGGYQNDGASAWNSVTAPMIITGGYTIRSSRMGFTTGTSIPDTAGDITLAVNAPNHPIFAGIELSGGTMVNPYAGIAVYPTNGTTLARGISVNNSPINAEGTLLATVATATDPAVGGLMIGEWQAGATLTHDGGAGTDILGGHRLVFLTGSRETNGISGDTAGLYDLYEDGTQMFLNAVEYMLQ